jgi:hypothetical protein
VEIDPMNMQVLDARRDTSSGFKVDVSRGERHGRVSSEWFSRQLDERYLSLSDLAQAVRDRADRSRTHMVENALVHVEANRNDPERLALTLTGADALVFRPTRQPSRRSRSVSTPTSRRAHGHTYRDRRPPACRSADSRA